MLKLKQKGRNTDYPKKGLLWTFLEKDIPDWVSDNFQVILGEAGKPELYYLETNTGFQIFMYSVDGTKKAINIKSKEDGGLVLSKTHPILYLGWKGIDLLYDKKELRH